MADNRISMKDADALVQMSEYANRIEDYEFNEATGQHVYTLDDGSAITVDSSGIAPVAEGENPYTGTSTPVWNQMVTSWETPSEVDHIYDCWMSGRDFYRYTHSIHGYGAYHAAVKIGFEWIRVLTCQEVDTGWLVIENTDNMNQGGFPGRFFIVPTEPTIDLMFHTTPTARPMIWNIQQRRDDFVVRVEVLGGPRVKGRTDQVVILSGAVYTNYDADTLTWTFSTKVDYTISHLSVMTQQSGRRLAAALEKALKFGTLLDDWMKKLGTLATEQAAQREARHQARLTAIQATKPDKTHQAPTPRAVVTWKGRRVWDPQNGLGTVMEVRTGPSDRFMRVRFDGQDAKPVDISIGQGRERLIFLQEPKPWTPTKPKTVKAPTLISRDDFSVPDARVSFETWMKQVDQIVEQRVGLSVYDLPDQPFADWYGDGIAPMRAAGRAIKYAKDEGYPY